MNILVPVACYHEYNTARYVATAFQQLGHLARIITQAEFYEDHPGVNLFFGVDSAGPLDFPEKHLSKTTMWFIDSRHNCDPARRCPDDDTNAAKVAGGGGWIFQAQKQDWLRNLQAGTMQAAWLPLAADPEVWKPDLEVTRMLDVAFGGNVWDGTRREILDRIAKVYSLGTFIGSPENLASAYSSAKVGFNISSFYGTPVAYDINMRVFEVLSCGVPLVTNDIPELAEVGIMADYHCLTYHNLEEVLPKIQQAMSEPHLGERGREYILADGTYKHRMEHALEILAEAGMIDG